MHQSPSTSLDHAISAQERDCNAVDWAWKGLFRGLLWRIKLGVLPSSSPHVEELRQAAANSRRKYAELRRQLLVDPHVIEVSPSSKLSNMDNPLSQDPDSVWSRHFQISELEETIDNDLTRLYPEHGDFFQSTFCQAMLRRILLVWSLMYPSCSYRQGMHELLAPLLYVLYCDVTSFSEMKQRYKDVFDDRFEEPFCLELRTLENGGKARNRGLACFKAVSTFEDSLSHVCIGLLEKIAGKKCASLHMNEWNYGLKILVMGNDTYGAEGELGVLFSGRFMEHDAFFMFNALMCGKTGGVNMADFFLPPNSAGLSPALEASAFLYKALATVDLPLQSHLKGLSVEPQFFALRWIRILFGREFDLQSLLILWDSLLSMADFDDSNMPYEDLIGCLNSPKRVFMIAVALSMLLYLRLTLFAAPNATACLQKLLNFPQTASIEVLIESARNLCPLVKETANSFAKDMKSTDANKTGTCKKSSHKSLSDAHTGKFSSDELQKSFPDFYWEEKWKNFVLREDAQLNCKNMQGDTESNQGSPFASGTNHLVGNGNTLTRDANKKVGSGGERLPFVMPANAGSTSMQGAFQDDRATPQFTGKKEKIQQTVFLVADNSNQGGLKTSQLETSSDSSALVGTSTPVLNLPKKSDSQCDYESTDSDVPVKKGSHQTPGPLQEKESLPECLRTDEGHESPFSANQVAQADPVSPPASASKPPLRPWKYWMWSFGKSRGEAKEVDKNSPSHLATCKEQKKAAPVNANVSADKMSLMGKAKSDSKSRESNAHSNHANGQCRIYSSIVSDEMYQPMVGENDTISTITDFAEAASHSTNLQRLGQCMSNKIQVIETALARSLTSETKIRFRENCDLCDEVAKSPGEANSSEILPQTVQVAIEELKNISNNLLQM